MLPLCSAISWWLLFIMDTCSVETFIDNRGTLTWFIIVSPDWIPPDEPWAYSVFGLLEWDYDMFSRIWCHYSGIPCQNWGNHLEIAIFGRFCLIMCMPITKFNVMTPVLLKTSIKAFPHPLPHHPPHPLGPILYPTPCPLPKPFLQHFAPPCQK